METVIEPILQHASSSLALIKDLEYRAKFGTLRQRREKDYTIPDPFLLTVPKRRRIPNPMVSIPTTIKPLPVPKTLYIEPKEKSVLEKISIYNKSKAVGLLSLKSFKAAIPPTISKKEVVRAKLELEEASLRNIPRCKPAPAYSSNNVKLNVTAILREEALLKKNVKEQIKVIQQLEMGMQDEKEIENRKLRIRAKEAEDQELALEKRRLEVQMAHVDVILAKQELLKENKEKADLVTKEKKELKQQVDSFRHETAAENRVKKLQIDAIQLNVVKAREKMVDEKLQRALAVQIESREMQEQSRKEQEEELKKKTEMIQQIRLLESLQPKHEPKEIDLSESPGFGLLTEMTIAEVHIRI